MKKSQLALNISNTLNTCGKQVGEELRFLKSDLKSLREAQNFNQVSSLKISVGKPNKIIIFLKQQLNQARKKV